MFQYSKFALTQEVFAKTIHAFLQEFNNESSTAGKKNLLIMMFNYIWLNSNWIFIRKLFKDVVEKKLWQFYIMDDMKVKVFIDRLYPHSSNAKKFKEHFTNQKLHQNAKKFPPL